MAESIESKWLTAFKNAEIPIDDTTKPLLELVKKSHGKYANELAQGFKKLIDAGFDSSREEVYLYEFLFDTAESAKDDELYVLDILAKAFKVLKESGCEFSRKTTPFYLLAALYASDNCNHLLQPSLCLVTCPDRFLECIPSLALLQLEKYNDDKFKSSLDHSLNQIAFKFEQERLYDAFVELRQMIQTATSPFKEHMVYNLGHILMLAQAFKLSIDTIISAIPLFKALLEHHDPDIKEYLTYALLKAIQEDGAFPRQILSKDAKVNKQTLTKSLLLMMGKEVSTDTTIFTHKFFKDSKNRKTLIQCLCRLSSASGLTLEDKQHVLSLFNQKEASGKPVLSGRTGAETALKYLETLNSLLILEESNQLKHDAIDSLEHLEATLKNRFETFIGEPPNVDNIAARFFNTFAQFRKPNSLFVYASTLTRLDEPDRTICLDALKTFIGEVLSGDFHQNRYQSKHMETIESHLGPDAMRNWKKGEAASLGKCLSGTPVEAVTTAIDSGTFDYQAFFYQQIVTDAHLDKSIFSALVAYLEAVYENNEQALSQWKETIGKEREELIRTQSNKNKQRHQQLELSNLIIELIESKDATAEKKKSKLNGIKRLLDKMDVENKIELHAQIGGLLIPVNFAKSSDYTIADTDDPCDLLLLGTEVAGSCQRISGIPKLNKGLLGYLLDGAHRAIVIKKPDGVIVARSLLRLLWDEKKQKAVLFQARIYPDNAPEALKKSLVEMAIHRAEILGVPLAGSSARQDILLGNYLNPLKLLSSRAPHNYVDACSGVQSGDGYEIAGGVFPLLYRPITPHKAALDEVLEHAFEQYSKWITERSNGWSSFGLWHHHGKDGVNRAYKLRMDIIKADDFEMAISHLHDFFNDIQHVEAGEKEIRGKMRANPHSFISFFLNELKNSPEVIEQLNAFCSDHSLMNKIVGTLDYHLGSSTRLRQDILHLFKGLGSNEDNPAPSP